MNSQPETSYVTISQSVPLKSYSLAYVQRSWVQDFVSADSTTLSTATEEEELLIALPA